MPFEYQEHHEIKTASDRSFGLTVGGILLLIEAVRTWQSGGVDIFGYILITIGMPLFLLGLFYPKPLSFLNNAWTRLGFLLFKVFNPVVMFLIYLLTILPTGLVLRLMGKDPLRRKFQKEASSYWIKRDPAGPTPESMKNQF